MAIVLELMFVCLDEAVFVKLKPYNSYCVAKLWIGFTTGARKEGSLDPHQIGLMKEVYKTYLSIKNIYLIYLFSRNYWLEEYLSTIFEFW